MDPLLTLLSGLMLGLGFVALGLGSVVAGLASPPGHDAPPPARTSVMLVESDVHGGVRVLFP